MRITNHANSTAPAQPINNSNEGVMHRRPLIIDVPFYPGPTYRPWPKPVRSPTQGSYESSESSKSSQSTDLNTKINIDLEENSPFQEGVISEVYQRPNKLFFQEPQGWQTLVNTWNLVQTFLPKQADKDKMLKVIQRKVLKDTHLPVEI